MDEDSYLAEQARAQESKLSYQLEFLQQKVNREVTRLSERWLPEVVKNTTAATGSPAVVGQWGAVKSWPFVFASAAALPDGRISVWGADYRANHTGTKYTYTGVWDPLTDQITEQGYGQHAMFCAVPTMRENGQVFVVGGEGASNHRTSTFDYRTNIWTHIDSANAGRWYNGSLQLPNGQVFMALGSEGSRYPELWTEGKGWKLLTGIDLQAPILDYTSYLSPNWFPQLSLTPNGKILHVGPTPKMHYIDPTGNGSIAEAGTGITGWDTHNSTGGIVDFDKGKLLTFGGIQGLNRTVIVDMNSSLPQVTPVANMTLPRSFANGVVLPNGEVLVIGGNANSKFFSDVDSIFTPEIWNPQTKSWHQMADHAVPRNYHSVALLMTDGRVFSGGGGLCNCAADHPDHQIYSPPYLFNTDGSLAIRPTIDAAPDTATFGQTINVQTSADVQKFSLVKLSATTHAYNTDQRFLNVASTGNNGQFQLNLESNPNVLTPGYWMLFALNSQGTPSVAKVFQIRRVLPTHANTPGAYRYVKLVAESHSPGSPSLSVAEFNVLDNNGSAIDRTGWSAIADSQEYDAPAKNAIDGKTSTMWHTQWRVIQPPPPHHLIIDMGTGYDVSGFTYLPRQDVNKNDSIARYGFYVSVDGINWSQPLVRGTFTIGKSLKTISFIGATPLFNVARGQASSQSSILANTPAAALDGNTSGNWGDGSITKTNNETNAWWEVDLGKSFDISTIKIWNRTDCCADRLADFHVLVSDAPFVSKDLVATQSQAGVKDTFFAGVPGKTTSLNVNKVGRYVRVQLAGTNYLSLAEVEVFSTLDLPVIPIAIKPLQTTPKVVGSTISYTANISGGGSNVRYKWLFGDGSAETDWSISPATSHSFANAGLYTATVMVADDSGQEASQNFYQAIHGAFTESQPRLSQGIAYEERSANDRVWNVNPDNGTVSVLDAVTNQKISEITVGTNPHSLAIAPDGRIWVTNKFSASISIIDPTTLSVVQTLSLPRASQPFGIVFAPDDSAAYVALEATGQLLKLNSSNGVQLGAVKVGVNVRHLSINGDSSKVYVSRFITPPFPNEATAAPQVTSGGGEVIVVNTATMGITTTIRLAYSDVSDTDSGGRGIPNYLGPAVIAPDGLSAWMPSKKDNIARGTLRDGNNLNFENTVRSISSYIDLANNQENLGKRIDFNNGGIASTAIFDRFGNYLFVALEGSREVAVVDAYGHNELFRINVGRAPQGLALSPGGTTLYVHNFMDRSVSVHNLSDLINSGTKAVSTVAAISTVANEKLAADVLLGKQLFYDAKDTRLARDNYISCASCHNEGGHDGRVWDLTGMGEGLRNTIDLRGRSGTGHGRLHWSANFDEVQDFEGQIRSLAGGTGLMSDADFTAAQATLGLPKAGKSADLDALAAYVTSLNTFAPSPLRNSDGSLTADAAAGKALFASSGCGQCHSGTPFTDSPSGAAHDVGGIKASSGKRLNSPLTAIDTPTLRDVWNTAPYLHDGSAATIGEAISTHTGITINSAQVAQVAAYVGQIGGTEPKISSNTPPAVNIASPTNGAAVSGASVVVTANATDSDGIAGVQFKLDGINLGAEDTSAPYTVNWDSSVAANSTHSLTAVARNTLGVSTTSATITVTVSNTSLPDVVVTSMSYANGSFTSTIKNKGTAPTPAGVWVGVGYYVDGVYNTYGVAVRNLAAGASATIAANTTPYIIPNGIHTIKAIVDDVNRIPELNETNNALEQIINVSGVGLPDVVVTAVTYANGIFTSTIKNQGAAPTPAGVWVGVGYYVDGVYNTYGVAVRNLAAGASATIAANATPYIIPSGSHTVTAYADDVNRFAEKDKTNNKLSIPVNVP